jgi:hypothetical protein
MGTLRSTLEDARPWRIGWNVLRLATAVAIVLATAEQIRLARAAGATVGMSASDATMRLSSFFTVQSNVLAAVVLVWAAVRGLSRSGRDSTALAVALVAASTYMVVTGLVYNLVLRQVGDSDIMMGWSNGIHHIVAPVILLADALLGPGRRALPWRAGVAVLAFPLVWVIVTLVRGPHLTSPSSGASSWYPYPFLDPDATAGGYLGVAVWVAGISAVIAATGFLVLGAGRWRSRASGHPRRLTSAPVGR